MSMFELNSDGRRLRGTWMPSYALLIAKLLHKTDPRVSQLSQLRLTDLSAQLKSSYPQLSKRRCTLWMHPHVRERCIAVVLNTETAPVTVGRKRATFVEQSVLTADARDLSKAASWTVKSDSTAHVHNLPTAPL